MVSRLRDKSVTAASPRAQSTEGHAALFPARRQRRPGTVRHDVLHRFLSRTISGAIALGAVLGLWWGLSAGFHMSVEVLPTPWDVVKAAIGSSGALGANSIPTVELALFGFVASALLGVPLGWYLSKPSKLGAVFSSGVLFAQVFPKIAVAPLLIVWFGFGDYPKVLFVFLLGFFPIVINSAAGFAGVSTEVRDLAYMLRLSGWRRVLKIELPAALPNIFSGLRISASFAVIAEIVFEFVGSQRGLGYFALNAETTLDVPLMFAAFGLIAIFGLALYGTVALAESLCIPWHVSQRRIKAPSRPREKARAPSKTPRPPG